MIGQAGYQCCHRGGDCFVYGAIEGDEDQEHLVKSVNGRSWMETFFFTAVHFITNGPPAANQPCARQKDDVALRGTAGVVRPRSARRLHFFFLSFLQPRPTRNLFFAGTNL